MKGEHFAIGDDIFDLIGLMKGGYKVEMSSIDMIELLNLNGLRLK